jgi:hypothetical protein
MLHNVLLSFGLNPELMRAIAISAMVVHNARGQPIPIENCELAQHARVTAPAKSNTVAD